MAEKLIFRSILAVVGVLFLVALVGSLDDLKRYLKIRAM